MYSANCNMPLLPLPCSSVAVALGGLTLWHAMLISRGETSIERHINRKEARRLKEKGKVRALLCSQLLYMSKSLVFYWTNQLKFTRHESCIGTKFKLIEGLWKSCFLLFLIRCFEIHIIAVKWTTWSYCLVCRRGGELRHCFSFWWICASIPSRERFLLVIAGIMCSIQTIIPPVFLTA